MSPHDQLRDRIQDVLHEADASSGAIVSSTDSDGDQETARTELLETAEEASDILETTDPSTLLEALGLDTLPDGSEPGSIPAAVARAEPERLEALQRLLSLAKLADRYDGGTIDGAVDDLRKTVSETGESAAESEPGAANGVESDDESISDRSDATETERGDATETERGDATEATDEPEERLRSALQSSFSAFGDEIQQLRDQLETASTDSESDEKAGSAEGGSEEKTEDAVPSPELESGRDRGVASARGSHHSTIAPSPSKRADMRGLARFSTMPDKRRE
ncbi:hypothetical protein [Natrinema halophilum]|nr:hypothetical protein [Natrinema halophilum]QLG47541.2 hypothetical protein HYG82_01105 [Natrinema halophilum]